MKRLIWIAIVALLAGCIETSPPPEQPGDEEPDREQVGEAFMVRGLDVARNVDTYRVTFTASIEEDYAQGWRYGFMIEVWDKRGNVVKRERCGDTPHVASRAETLPRARTPYERDWCYGFYARPPVRFKLTPMFQEGTWPDINEARWATPTYIELDLEYERLNWWEIVEPWDE